MRIYQGKLCDQCGVRPATCHTVIEVNGIRYEADLCEECFLQRKAMAQPVYQNFMNAELECPVCHTRLSEVRGSQYVGCSECYNVFRKEVLSGIQDLHGTRKHVGKRLRATKQSKNVDLSERESIAEQYHLARDEGRDDDAEELFGFLRGDDNE